jgi:hypothetical protein
MVAIDNWFGKGRADRHQCLRKFNRMQAVAAKLTPIKVRPAHGRYIEIYAPRFA